MGVRTRTHGLSRTPNADYRRPTSQRPGKRHCGLQEAGEKTRGGEGVFLSPAYSSDHQAPPVELETLENDYALLELRTPLDFEGRHKHLMPVCLPEPNQGFEEQNCTISGWGLTKDRSQGGKIPAKLQKADVPVVKHATCKEYYQSINEVKEETMICAGPEEGGRSVCQGDSGGPLQCPRADGRYVLAASPRGASPALRPGSLESSHASPRAQTGSAAWPDKCPEGGAIKMRPSFLASISPFLAGWGAHFPPCGMHILFVLPIICKHFHKKKLDKPRFLSSSGFLTGDLRFVCSLSGREKY
ncbi:hypothetical protein HPB48_005016 [Haemaphysalis longicornis]|uniref:Peptidase S1 domain-containing protein n=1 Tax=Haemaphysalis longicornis TaxID=44386 RepID=A0A9J6GEP7_HAELO|nr:hypothetical protein HPB48_005016 [Haemaphysalis longicornis]